jgi:putative membrane protein
MAVLFFLFAVMSWNACSKDYSLEDGKNNVIGDLLPGDDSTSDDNNDDDDDDNDDDDNDDGDDNGDNGDGDDSPTLADVDFIKKATYINRAQINNAKLAIERGTVVAVSDFGRALQTRFTQAQDDMDALGVQMQVAIPGQTDAAHQAVTNSFLDMEGRTFDIGYIDYQMLELQRAIEMYRAQIANGTDPRVKAYAEKYLPYLEGFLQSASQIRQSL